jgi:hypothetical protein
LQIDARTSTAYHPQTDGLTERTNQTLETYLRAYVSYQQNDWVDYLPLAEFAFNNLENESTKQTPFFAQFAFHPSFEPKITDSSVPAAVDLTTRLEQIHAELRAELEHAQEIQMRAFNRHTADMPDIQPGQLVWLLRRNIKTTRPTAKLDHRRLGPYRVIRPIGSRAFLLQLPPYLSRLHPVFHVSLLEPYKDPSDFHAHAEPDPFELDSEDDTATQVHAILDSRKIGQRYDYLIRFRNSSPDEDAWIPLSDLPTTANELIDHYHRRHPRSHRPPQVLFNQTHSLSPIESIIPPTNITPSPPITDTQPATTPPAARRRSPSPVAIRQNLRINYTPPQQTTTRSGRVSRPPQRPDN